jgi:tetratricopeptide (TPR) repeat protein
MILVNLALIRMLVSMTSSKLVDLPVRTPHTRSSWFRMLPLALALATAIPVQAQELTDPVVRELNDLVTRGRYEEAYAFALENLDEYEGAPEFDFLYGLAAMDSGRPTEAVFALERIAYTYPDQQRVKLELARAFYLTNNLPAARQLFTEVLDTDPTPNVQANIQAFLTEIDSREENLRGTLTWYVNSGIGNDSNINSATELGVIPTPIGDVELSSNGQSIDDSYADIGGGVSYAKPFSKTSALTASANYTQHNNFSTSAFDLDVLAADVGYAHVVKETMRFSYGARVQRVDLDGEHFQDSASAITSWQRSPGDGWSQALTGAYTQVRFDDGINANASFRDVNQVLLSGVLGKTSGNFFHSVSAYVGDESAVKSLGKNNAQQFYGIAFSEQFQFRPAHIPYFRISLHHSENQARDPIFNIEREDDTFSTSLGWVWRANRNINLTTDVTYTDNDSNLDLYAYDRVKYQTSLRYQF